MKKTRKSGKKAVKKIWVSRDEHQDRIDFLDVWSSKPEYADGYYDGDSDSFLGNLGAGYEGEIFGCFNPGQCKCFEIREVKE